MKRLVAVLLLLLVLSGLALAWRAGLVLPPDPDAITGTEVSEVEGLLRQGAERPLAAGQTDVVLAVVCTLRKDRLEPYGARRPTSPFLRRLAEAGVTFDKHFAQAPWTRPSVGSIVTGRWPRALQLDNPGAKGSLRLVLDSDETTLAEVLSANGYATAASTGNPNIKARFGFTQGFDAWFEPDLTWHQKDGVALAEDGDQVDSLLAWASEQPADQPLYARVVMISTHMPRQYRSRDLVLFQGRRNKRVPPYEAAVRNVDAELARLYVGLAERRKNLLFVVVADHGEGLALPRHHGASHGKKLVQTVIGVPWMVSHPALPAGHRVSGLTMNIDVKPTILDLLGLAADPAVEGLSQAAVIRGETEATGHDAVFSETFYEDIDAATVLDGSWQLTRDRRTGRERLFAFDDWKAVGRVGNPVVQARLGAELDSWEAERAASVTGEPVEADPDEATDRALEALGYVE